MLHGSRKALIALLMTLLLLTALLVSETLFAQSDAGELRIIELDGAAFPEMFFRLVATDANGNAITDSSGLRLFEDDSIIENFSAEGFDPGAELIIVLDANTTIEQRDGNDDLSRREKVRDSIIRYASHYMDPMQKDWVTIIVPEGDGARILDKENLSFPNEVINAANFYQSGPLGDTDLDLMLQMALEMAVGNQSEGRHQSILLFSDATDLADNLEIDSFVHEAAAQNVALYAAILGNRADVEEIENITRLTGPTNGAYVHMPDPKRADPLYEAIQQRASQLAVTYRSSLNTSGQHTLTAEMGGAQNSTEYELLVEPAIVQMAVDNSRPIRRVAETVEMPLDLMQPVEQPLVAQVDWPDEHPRDLVSAALLIEGVQLPAEQAILDDTGLLTFVWDIRQLDEGIYDLKVQVTDELGLTSTSDPLPLTILVERPVLAPTETPESVPTPAPTQIPEPVIEPTENNDEPLGIAMIIGGLFLLVGLLAAVLAAVFFLRNRSGAADALPPSPDSLPAAARNNDYTYLVPPEFAMEEGIGAYLEVLENAPEHQGLIPVAANNVALGRDSRRAQIVFSDRSVSRLHARILESRGEYRIYEEGSSSGTYVNFERIGLTPRTLHDMDRIHLGRVHLRFHLASSLRPASGPAEGTNTEAGIPGI